MKASQHEIGSADYDMSHFKNHTGIIEILAKFESLKLPDEQCSIDHHKRQNVTLRPLLSRNNFK